MLLSSCVRECPHLRCFLGQVALSTNVPLSPTSSRTHRHMHVGTHVPCRQTPKFLNQKSDNIGHPNEEEVGRQRRVPIIELVFGAKGERRSGQKSQWKATLKLLQNSRFLCAPQIPPLAY